MGRVAKKLASMLEAMGFRDVTLHAARGYWRTDPRADVVRWEGRGANLIGVPVQFSSWDTMTECVRTGIVLNLDDPEREIRSATFFDVSAKAGV